MNIRKVLLIFCQIGCCLSLAKADPAEICTYDRVPVKDGCTRFAGSYYSGSWDYNPIAEQTCHQTPGCSVEDGPVDGFWRCVGTPDCSDETIKNDWNYCKSQINCHCSDGYKYYQGQTETKTTCQKILCYYHEKPYVLYESKSETLYDGKVTDHHIIGNRLVTCQQNGEMKYHVDCNYGWYSDGYTCISDKIPPF